jgi:SAM-dependent methyltransferase
MRYCGFNIRDNLILKHLPLDRSFSVLEIGVGLGSVVDSIKDKVKEYYGIDIACDLIEYLKLVYKNAANIYWFCMDVCKHSSFLGKKFDIIFSADTLEHVDSPREYFNFISAHIKPNGSIFIFFPNESEKKHHGITWFNSKKELIEVINRAGLSIIELKEVKKTIWHVFIRDFFWGLPKSIISSNKNSPQTFEKTMAFKIAQSRSILKNIVAFYVGIIMNLAKMFPLYKYVEVGDDITEKALFINLKNKI